jgi:hypothetical protein
MTRYNFEFGCEMRDALPMRKHYFSILVQWSCFLISYACSRRSDMMNGRLPIFQPTDLVTDFPVIHAPSMRRRGSGDSREDLICRILEEPTRMLGWWEESQSALRLAGK